MRRTRTYRLIDVFPHWYLGVGIFSVINVVVEGQITWLSEIYDTLDTEYIGEHSGNKVTSPLLDRYIERNIDAELEYPEQLTSEQLTVLATIIVNRYRDKWGRLYDVISETYNPIHNYDMTEVETPDISHKHKVSEDFSESDSRTTQSSIVREDVATNDYETTETTKTGSDVITTTSGDSDGDTYGFNSASPVPITAASSESTSHVTGDAESNVTDVTRSQTGGTRMTETRDPNDNVETTEHTQTGYREDTETGRRSLTRSGNIGVTTSQQMILSEIDLRQWNFIEQIYKDVDSVLAIDVY